MRYGKLMSIASAMTLLLACNNGSQPTDRGPNDVAAEFVKTGDGKPDGVKPDGVKPTGDRPPACAVYGATCSNPEQCCSGSCQQSKCALGPCGLPGATCKVAGDCCNRNCTAGKCAAIACVADGAACTTGGAPCCSQQCVSGKCKALNDLCKTAGNPCGAPTDCCSKVCGADGKCPAPSKISFCTQTGDICSADSECCTGACQGKTATKPGTCAAIDVKCVVDGLLCEGCNTCCSSFCAPYGLSKQKVCQPASGCHVTGDLCHKDTDCCGGDATQIGAVPGAGLIKCIPDPNFPQIGTCSDPNPNNCPSGKDCGNNCVPEGDVCHSKEVGSCPSNSTRNDCCNAPGNSGVCKLDRIGIPRCYGFGTSCVKAGGACAYSGDCCNNLPCVPDATGHLKCGSACVPAGGICTATADCCTGLSCVVSPGMLAGICQSPVTPPIQTPDGGVRLDKTLVPDKAPPPPPCAFWGQSCSTTVSCCLNQGKCLGPASAGSKACVAGETDCTCYEPIP